jgi:MFS family permease
MTQTVLISGGFTVYLINGVDLNLCRGCRIVGMTTHEPVTDDLPGSWAELFSGRYARVMVVLAGGVALYATNVYVAISLLPSAIGDIGGERFYSWSTTVFLLASVVTSVLVSRMLAAVGSRASYVWALGVFLAGTVLCAVAPTMPALLAGRAVQGAGGGLLAGLAYALIRSSLPPSLWARGSALVSAMWGAGTFVGPALGGAFAQFGSWRGAFLALAVLTVGVLMVVPRALAGASRPEPLSEPFPLVALVLLTSAALVVSVAGLSSSAAVAAGGVAAGLVLVAGFVGYERRSRVRVLPAVTFRGGSRLRLTYATIALLAMASMVEGFIPLFGQRLAGLGPLLAGFLGATLALGWTLGELPSASASRPGTVRRIIIAGPVLVGVGLVLAALTQHPSSGGWLPTAWVVAYLLIGAGVGIAWPHLSTEVMTAVTDEGEGDKASAAINTVQLVANAFGAALTGVAVNLGQPDTARSAVNLFAGFVVLAVLGVLTAVLSQRRTAPASR